MGYHGLWLISTRFVDDSIPSNKSIPAWGPRRGGQHGYQEAYGALCASMKAMMCRIRSTMCEHGSQAVPHTEHYVRSMEAMRCRARSIMCEHGGQEAYGALCASMRARRCRIRSMMCEHGSQDVPHTELYVRAWRPRGVAYGALCASMGARTCRILGSMCQHEGQWQAGASLVANCGAWRAFLGRAHIGVVRAA